MQEKSIPACLACFPVLSALKSCFPSFIPAFTACLSSCISARTSRPNVQATLRPEWDVKMLLYFAAMPILTDTVLKCMESIVGNILFLFVLA